MPIEAVAAVDACPASPAASSAAVLKVGPQPPRSGTRAAPGCWLTDAVDAERDLQRVAEVMKRMG
jgi:hypothetical protein